MKLLEVIMKKYLYLILPIILVGCSTMGFNVYQEKTAAGITLYQSSQIAVPMVSNQNNQEIRVVLKYWTLDTKSGWLISVDCPAELINSAETRLIIFCDDEMFEFPVNVVQMNNKVSEQVAEGRYDIDFQANQAIFKTIIFAKNTSLIAEYPDGKMEGRLTVSNRDDFGLFYNYIRKNVIENKTVIYKA